MRQCALLTCEYTIKMPRISEVNQATIDKLKRYYGSLAPLKKRLLPWGIHNALSKLNVMNPYLVSEIKPLMDALEKSWSFLINRNIALRDFKRSPLAQACQILRSSLGSAMTPDVFEAIAKCNRPLDVANAFVSLQKLGLLSIENRQRIVEHQDHEFLAKALNVLSTIRPLPANKKEVFFDTIVKSSIPMAVANVLCNDEHNLFYNERVPANAAEAASRKILTRSRFPLQIEDALSYLKLKAPILFGSDAILSAIETIGAHTEPLQAAQLVAYLFKEGLLTAENCALIAAHPRPKALLNALNVSIDDDVKQSIIQLWGFNTLKSILQANLARLSMDENPESLGFSLGNQSKENLYERLFFDQQRRARRPRFISKVEGESPERAGVNLETTHQSITTSI